MNGVHEKVQRHYDEVAEIYDSRYDRKRGRLYYSHISRHVMSCLPKKGSLLDLGCGTGLFVHRYVSCGGDAVGLDLSRGMLQKARSRCRGHEFTVGTAELIPFHDNTFDAVSSLLAFSYVRSPDLMLAESFRVLKPGGAIALCTLGRNILTSGLPAVYSIGEAMKLRHVGMGDFAEHYYNEHEMQELMAGAGFDAVEVRRCSFAHINLIDPLYCLARRIEPFVEEKLPRLAYNILASARKPEEE